MDSPIINKVAESGLVTIDLEKFLPAGKVCTFDLAPFLLMGQVLREKDFREAMENHEWESYRDASVAVFCSADAIVPHWSYMLVAARLSGIAKEVYPGTLEQMQKHLLMQNIGGLPVADFADKRVVVKGCGDTPIGEYAFLAVASLLTPHVRSLMYGEPCSTVPVFKRR